MYDFGEVVQDGALERVVVLVEMALVLLQKLHHAHDVELSLEVLLQVHAVYLLVELLLPTHVALFLPARFGQPARLLQVVGVEALGLVEAGEDEGDERGEDVVLHVAGHVVLELFLLDLQRLVELRRAEPVLLVNLRLLQVLDRLEELLLLDPAVDLLAALVAYQPADDAADERADHRNGDEHLAGDCAEDGSADGGGGVEHEAAELLQLLLLGGEAVGEDLVEVGAEGTREDHVAHDRNLVHDLLHRASEDGAFGQVLEELGDAAVSLHQVEATPDYAVEVGVALQRLAGQQLLDRLLLVLAQSVDAELAVHDVVPRHCAE